MESYRLYPGVKLGGGADIGDFVIIGLPPATAQEGELETIIGQVAIIRSHTVIYAGNKIGNHFQTGHGVMIRENNEIGDRVSIGTGSVIEHHIKIGHSVRIHSQAFIPEYSILEDGCWIGPNVVVTNVLHPLCPKAKTCAKGATIKKGAIIGANSTLVPGITIEERALVGAGSVVVKDVPEGYVVAGNPAKLIKEIKDLTCPYHLIERPYPLG